MRETRIINRVAVTTAIALGVAAVCAEFEQLTDLQFVAAKAMACVWLWASCRLTARLHAEGRI